MLQTGNQMCEVEVTTSERVRFEVAETLRLLELELRNALNSPSPEVRCGVEALLARVNSDQKTK